MNKFFSSVALLVGTLAAGEAPLRSDAQAEWNRMAEKSDGQQISAEITYRVVSSVGRYVSVEKEIDCDCGGAHPISVKTFATLAPAKQATSAPQLVSLVGLFPPQSLLSALKADKVVAETLRNLGSPQSATLSELLGTLRFQSVTVGECSYSFGENLLEHFAFYDVLAERVAVRIGLSAQSEECRGQMTQLGLSLPAPQTLRADLAAARANRSGFLMARTGKDPAVRAHTFRFP